MLFNILFYITTIIHTEIVLASSPLVVPPTTLADHSPTQAYFNHTTALASSQLRLDAHRVIDQFADALLAFQAHQKPSSSFNRSASDTVNLFKNILHGAMSYQLFHGFENSTRISQDQLSSMAVSINDTLNSINDVADQLLTSTNGALKFADLRNCLLSLVQQGGLHDGQSCVMQGVSITGVSEIITSVLKNFGDGIIPTNIIQLTTQALDPILSSLLPRQEALVSSINQAIRSVQSSISGELVQALDDAFRCFQTTAFAKISYQERLQRTRECNRNASSSSVFRDLRTLYLSIINQFVGFATPNVLESIHQLSNEYLDNGIEVNPEDHFFRNAVSASVKSIVASNAGSQVTYAYKIADCLDTVVGVQDPDAAANRAATARCLEKPDGPPALLRQIVYGYVQQIYGVLPVKIASEIERSGILNLSRSSADYDQQVKRLHEIFLKTDVGPAYVSCYERFIDCLFDVRQGGALVLAPSQNPHDPQSVCLLGKACWKTPDGKQNPRIGIGS